MPYTGSDCNDAPFGFSWDSNYTLNGIANCPPIYGGYILRLGELDWGKQQSPEILSAKYTSEIYAMEHGLIGWKSNLC